jgi:hypothetical protein
MGKAVNLLRLKHKVIGSRSPSGCPLSHTLASEESLRKLFKEGYLEDVCSLSMEYAVLSRKMTEAANDSSL